MSPIDYFILAVVAVCFVLAVVFSFRKRKSGCCGDCNACAHCAGCDKKPPSGSPPPDK